MVVHIAYVQPYTRISTSSFWRNCKANTTVDILNSDSVGGLGAGGSLEGFTRRALVHSDRQIRSCSGIDCSWTIGFMMFPSAIPL